MLGVAAATTILEDAIMDVVVNAPQDLGQVSRQLMKRLNNMSYKSGLDKYSNFVKNYQIYGKTNVNLIKFSSPDLFDSLLLMDATALKVDLEGTDLGCTL